ncbi:MAG: DNA mismatch repair endonuclease MutL [Pirellulales bacterium]|nr:DNA mismatch repair endonuclease MutL [Pirellulales bacterium]
MTEIKQLPPHVVNKIAAGEVVERPASMVKELIENAIDSGATRIDLILREGGTAEVRVVDNGSGIAPDQLAMAVTSHATSKIESDDDLFDVTTLGFRGEALASIGSVAHLRIRSRTAESDAGNELQVDGGAIGEVTPVAAAAGTTVAVSDLFFNTPVRRKFLRTIRTELGHCTEIFTRLSLAHPYIHFSLTHEERLLHDLPPVADLRERIAHFFGRPLADKLLKIDSREGEIEITGYVAHPQESRPNTKIQYLLLGGRFIRDRSLQHALGEAYRGLLLRGRYPICFLTLRMPTDQVDVNVHPTKLEVRFRNAQELYRQLLSAIRNRFLEENLNTTLAPLQPEGAPVERTVRLPLSPNPTALQPETVHTAASNFSSTPRPHMEIQPDISPTTVSTEVDRPRYGEPIPAIQVMHRYLIAESDDTVIVMDQHALHESILYEKLRKKVLAGPIDRQPLLVPEPIDLAAEEAAVLIERRETLLTLGIEIEPFGGETVLLTALPALLACENRGDLLRSLATQLAQPEGQANRRDLIDDLLHMISCKAAIKAGDVLAPAEIQDLVTQRADSDVAHHCPHGRPTTLVLTREDLDRQFLRT